MENATKALIMAGSVLIALMIIGALILMFNSLTSYQKVGESNTKEAQIVEFNNQYETFNRKNVRGSDLYSLLNRVVDYNRRKSSEGTGKDDGQYLAYEPMTISFNFSGKLDDFRAPTASNKDEYKYLLRADKNEYIQGSTQNEFEQQIGQTVKELENKYGQNNLVSLVTGLTKIFISDNSSEAERIQAVNDYNKYNKGTPISSWESIKENSAIREDVYRYYEYIQFKRAKFDCESVTYNQKTGRITKMNFKFNGKFQ